jgi:hypothetical protein
VQSLAIVSYAVSGAAGFGSGETRFIVTGIDDNVFSKPAGYRRRR